jgi:aldehyde dehydrogenase (NAD+)
MNYSQHLHSLFQQWQAPWPTVSDPELAFAARTPIDGSVLCQWSADPLPTVDRRIELAHQRFLSWREVPAPRRGDLVRRFGDKVRLHKAALADLITIESGKIHQEGLGEVQEVIDICEFAVGLSRQFHGLTLPSERPQHKLMETWHPLGVVGIISAFNFPMAVWAWNAALALVCGNTLVWKPSEKTALCALALNQLLVQVFDEAGFTEPGYSTVLLGSVEVGQQLVEHPQVRLVSATGSTAMGRAVGVRCAQHFKRSLLELGGNNAAIVCPSANLDLVKRAVTFSAAGTAGQRCTTLRRLFIHQSLYRSLVDQLVHIFGRLPVGHPLEPDTLLGPLIDEPAYQAMDLALQQAQQAGAVLHGGQRLNGTGLADAYYVRPALIEMPAHLAPMTQETFAPILYVMPYTDLAEAIALNNSAAHGLSSSIFTQDLGEAEYFTSASGSDCGIANVNIGTSGAEIGGAFGGEKETGGGRESGSDSWKAYMRRATNTVNYGSALPLAQGIRFELE